MEITFEVELDYGPEGPEPDEASPSDEEVARAVREGLAAQGFRSVDVTARQL